MSFKLFNKIIAQTITIGLFFERPTNIFSVVRRPKPDLRLHSILYFDLDGEDLKKKNTDK